MDQVVVQRKTAVLRQGISGFGPAKVNAGNVSQLPMAALNCVVNGTTPKSFLSKCSTPEFACKEKVKLTCLAPLPDCPVCRRRTGL